MVNGIKGPTEIHVYIALIPVFSPQRKLWTADWEWGPSHNTCTPVGTTNAALYAQIPAQKAFRECLGTRLHVHVGLDPKN